MNKIGVDLIGEISLFNDSGKQNPIIKDHWGLANVKGEKRNDSYYVYLIDKEKLNLGQKAKAAFKFKFSDDKRFEIKLMEGQIIELNEGSRRIGEFIIQKIVKAKLK